MWSLLLLACGGDPIVETDASDTPPPPVPDPTDTPTTTTSTPSPPVTTPPTEPTETQGCLILRQGTGDLVIWRQLEQWNPEGQIVYQDWDGNNDGAIEWSWTATYDASGLNRTSREDDTNGDHIPDMLTTWAFDGDLVVGGTEDENADGVLERSWTLTYEGGDPRSYQLDEGANGIADAIGTYTYGVDGKLERYSLDLGPNGSPDEIHTWTWSLNDPTESIDFGADGDIDAVERSVFDDFGRLTFRERDDAAGLVTTTWTWHGATEWPELIITDADLLPDTIYHEEEGWFFDPFTDLVSRVDIDTDYEDVPGTFSSSELWTWSCP